MDMKRQWNPQSLARVSFIVMVVGCVLVLLLRPPANSSGPSIERIGSDGSIKVLTLQMLQRMDVLTREGVVQNQYGNWRDAGTYSGVLLHELLEGMAYSTLLVEAADGYRLRIDRSRVLDDEAPMVLAFRKDGEEVPLWEDGFRIVVLPEDGDLSNEEYGVESAGSFWVKNVIRVQALP